MKQTLTMTFSFLLLMNSIASTTYRTFKDSSGRAIQARLVQFDAESEVVTIERKDRKTAQLPLSKFSVNDRAYIRNFDISTESQDNISTTKELEPLTKGQVKDLAEQLEESIEDKDFESFSSLYLSAIKRPGNWDQMKRVDIGDIEDHVFHMQISADTGSNGAIGWVHLTPSGKIKYCPLTSQHPVELVAGAISTFDWLDRERLDAYKPQLNQAIRDLERSKVPTFGFKKNMPFNELKENNKKLKAWFKENCETYDVGTPKLPIPEKRLKSIKSNIKF
ncbi:hypothetical protein [Pontiella agarivorans]|uniref:SLA1 homology domain-containing protein n=1 Tax=Pontiella agarivorans TaxID=3038953 RepID=A0ABU5N291_9BACT|nr:hypothetical protein [Pontiella agarivorans]MDZ8120555.1 hypothetical protein [Pontiella agarivorans]